MRAVESSVLKNFSDFSENAEDFGTDDVGEIGVGDVGLLDEEICEFSNDERENLLRDV